MRAVPETGEHPFPKRVGIAPEVGAYHSQLQNSVCDCRLDAGFAASGGRRFERYLKNRISLFNGSG